MRKILTFLTILSALLFFFIYKCSDPVSYYLIDPELIGEWYTIDTVHYNLPSPNLQFYGIKIDNTDKVKRLGIETSTGKVAIWKDDYKTIITANQGILVLKYIAPPGMRTDTCTYNFENDKLIIKDDFSTRILTKTILGDQIFEPINSNLSFEFDTTNYENEKISNFPSAYICKISNYNLTLWSVMSSSYLNINVDEFNGPGNYEISIEEGKFIIWYGDAGFQYISDSSSTGYINIIEYDELNNICSGTFYFKVIGPVLAEIDTVEIRNGLFTVPIYKY